MALDANYWEGRYQEGNTPWDMNQASPPLTGFLQNRKNPNLEILIPGAGSAHEAEWLWRHGFQQVHVLDYSASALAKFRARTPDFPVGHLHQEDFFAHRRRYDLILEQTFFCALDPELRSQYAQHCASLLRPGGMLVGLLFNFPLTEQGPPFGGSEQEYRDLFLPHFKLYKLEPCYNSIPPRQGRELFIWLLKAS